MTTTGHVFIPFKREHDGMVPSDDDQTRFESLPVPLALWDPFQQRLSKHLSELTEGQIDREEMFWFDAARGGGGGHRPTGPAGLAHVACRIRSSRR